MAEPALESCHLLSFWVQDALLNSKGRLVPLSVVSVLLCVPLREDVCVCERGV